MTIKLLIMGASGSMGRIVSKLALEDPSINVVAACDVTNIGAELGTLVGTKDPNNIKISNSNALQKIIAETSPEVAVDFTVAKAAEVNSIICIKNNIRCVMGTTGLSKEYLANFKSLIKQHDIPAVISSNMAPGVNIFFKIATLLATWLNEWDIEIIETHHHRKVDSPSGTAITVGKLISDALGINFETVAKYGRSLGPNKRQVGAKKEIGIHAIRAGDIVGDHTVLYAGPGERIELKHQAHSRDCMANGAITAIKFIVKANESKIYTMQDVLNL